MTDWTELPPEQRITFLVGLLARSAADLDAATRTAFATLAGRRPSAAWDAPLPMVARIEAMKKLVRASPDLTNDERDVANSALTETLDAYQERNRYIHDRLLPSSESQDAWYMSRLNRDKGQEKPESRDGITEADLQACDRQLVRSGWRMWALSQVVNHRLSASPSYVQRRWLGLLGGDFSLLADNNISYSF